MRGAGVTCTLTQTHGSLVHRYSDNLYEAIVTQLTTFFTLSLLLPKEHKRVRTCKLCIT